jgi:PAS domain-containing protein
VAAQSARSRVDLVLVATEGARGRARSEVLLARIRAHRASFELLTAAAWARALGYAADELGGKSLRELMALDTPAAQELVATLLDENDARPLDVTLRCKDRRRKVFRFHRRADPYGEAIFVLAEELAFAAEQTGARPVANMDDGR